MAAFRSTKGTNNIAPTSILVGIRAVIFVIFSKVKQSCLFRSDLKGEAIFTSERSERSDLICSGVLLNHSS